MARALVRRKSVEAQTLVHRVPSKTWGFMPLNESTLLFNKNVLDKKLGPDVFRY